MQRAIILLILWGASSWAVDLTVESATLVPGEQTTLSITIANDAAITALQFDLQVSDPDQLPVNEVQVGSANPTHTLRTNMAIPRIVLYHIDSQELTNGSVIDLPISVPNSSTGETSITVTNVIAADANGNEFTASVTPGAIAFEVLDADEDGIPDWLEYRAIALRGNLNTLADTDDTTDVDGDGYPFWLEYNEGYGFNDRAAHPSWQMPLFVWDDTDFFEATIGYDETATDGVGPEDEETQSGELIYLITDQVSLTKDIRGNTVSHTWVVEYSALATDNGYVSWFFETLSPYHQMSYVIVSANHLADYGIGERLSMSETDFVELQPGDRMRIDFAPILHERELDAGWNLISPHVVPDFTAWDQLTNLNTAIVWSYDTRAQAYRQPESIAAGVGYWIHCDTARPLLLHGYETDQLDVTLGRGWNLTGFGDARQLPDDIPTYRYDAPDLVELEAPKFAPPGAGLWMFSPTLNRTVER